MKQVLTAVDSPSLGWDWGREVSRMSRLTCPSGWVQGTGWGMERDWDPWAKGYRGRMEELSPSSGKAVGIRQAARRAGLGARWAWHTPGSRGLQHTGVESLKAVDPLDPLMWAVTCELRQPDLFSALPGPGRLAWADFPSVRLWAGALQVWSQLPRGHPPRVGGLSCTLCPTSSQKAFWSPSEETPRELSHNRSQAPFLEPQWLWEPTRASCSYLAHGTGLEALVEHLQIIYMWAMLILRLAASLPSPRDSKGWARGGTRRQLWLSFHRSRKKHLVERKPQRSWPGCLPSLRLSAGPEPVWLGRETSDGMS